MERKNRFAEIDLVRGISLSLMIAFHLLWDLDYYGMKPLDRQMYQFSPGIAVVFFLLVGISIILASQKKTAKQFIVRGSIILFIGCCISAISMIVLPEKPVYFGVLHCIGVSMIISPIFIKLNTRQLYYLSIPVMMFGIMIGNLNVLEAGPLMVLGLHSSSLQTVDYFPMFPWFGIVLFGMALSGILYKDGKRQFPFPDITKYKPTRMMSWLGRHSLPVYLIHQPAISGVIIYIVPIVARYIPKL